MTTDKKPTPARQAPKPDERPKIRVLWGQPDEPKPREILIKWGAGDKITKQDLKEGKQDANRSTT